LVDIWSRVTYCATEDLQNAYFRGETKVGKLDDGGVSGVNEDIEVAALKS
jgi:hypothetical protein